MFLAHIESSLSAIDDALPDSKIHTMSTNAALPPLPSYCTVTDQCVDLNYLIGGDLSKWLTLSIWNIIDPLSCDAWEKV